MGIIATTLAILSIPEISENRYSKAPHQIHIEDMDLISFYNRLSFHPEAVLTVDRSWFG